MVRIGSRIIHPVPGSGRSHDGHPPSSAEITFGVWFLMTIVAIILWAEGVVPGWIPAVMAGCVVLSAIVLLAYLFYHDWIKGKLKG